MWSFQIIERPSDRVPVFILDNSRTGGFVSYSSIDKVNLGNQDNYYVNKKVSSFI